MRALPIALFLVSPISMRLAADTHQVTKTSYNGHDSVFEFYSKGKNFRTQSMGPDGKPREILIQDFNKKTIYRVDLAAKEYVESHQEKPDFLTTFSQWIARPPRQQKSGKTVDVYYETTDTGERKQFFGQTAKHLLVRERHVAPQGACDRTHVEERDGWFIPANASQNAGNLSFRLVGYSGFARNSTCEDTVVRHGNPSPPGLAVREASDSVVREVVELSHAPLDASLFTVPPGFKKVDALPGERLESWSDRMGRELTQVHFAVATWFH